MGFLDALKKGMKKTAAAFSFKKIDFNSLEQLEEALICADAGYAMTEEILTHVKRKKPTTPAEMTNALYEIIVEKLTPVARPLEIDSAHKPFVVLMTGVNGAGKTTTIGKLGKMYKEQGLKVSFVAADTFRAGATEQLQKWGERIGAPVYAAKTGADAAGLVFDAMTQSRTRGDDVLFIDTAGRLHNKTDLMNELEKITRVMKKVDESAPHATLLVLDATGGQNALAQVKAFSDCVGLTGLIMTKLDGTAKGGILLALTEAFHLPIHALGVGEQAEDLNAFTAAQYADSLLKE